MLDAVKPVLVVISARYSNVSRLVNGKSSLSFLDLFFKISLIRVVYDDSMKISKERQQGLEFHIKTNDYFGTLATVLDLSR